MQKKLILIVDDEPEIRSTLFEGLSKNGFSIFLADRAEKALRLLDQKPFDLVIICNLRKNENRPQPEEFLKEKFSNKGVNADEGKIILNRNPEKGN